MLALILKNPFGQVLLGLAAAVAAGIAFLAWLALHDASVAADARKGYVLLAEKLTAEQTAKELRRQLEAADASLNSFRLRLEADAKVNNARQKERENEILGYELRLSQANRSCFLDRSDLEFLQRN